MVYNSKTNVQVNSVEDVVFNGVMSVLSNIKKGSSWIGTMTALDAELITRLSKKESQMLPASPSALRVVLNRVVNRLRNRSISVKFGRTTDNTRTRFVKFSR